MRHKEVMENKGDGPSAPNKAETESIAATFNPSYLEQQSQHLTDLIIQHLSFSFADSQHLLCLIKSNYRQKINCTIKMSKFSPEEITRACKEVLESKNFAKEKYDLATYCMEIVLGGQFNLSTAIAMNCYASDITEEEVRHFVGLATKRIFLYRKENLTLKHTILKERMNKSIQGVVDKKKLSENQTIRKSEQSLLSHPKAHSQSTIQKKVITDLLDLDQKYKPMKGLLKKLFRKEIHTAQMIMNNALDRSVGLKKKEDPLNQTISAVMLSTNSNLKNKSLRLTIPKTVVQSSIILDASNKKTADQSLKPNRDILNATNVRPKKDILNASNAKIDNQRLKLNKNILDVPNTKTSHQILMPKKDILDASNTKTPDRSLKPKKVILKTPKKKAVDQNFEQKTVILTRKKSACQSLKRKNNILDESNKKIADQRLKLNIDILDAPNKKIADQSLESKMDIIDTPNKKIADQSLESKMDIIDAPNILLGHSSRIAGIKNMSFTELKSKIDKIISGRVVEGIKSEVVDILARQTEVEIIKAKFIEGGSVDKNTFDLLNKLVSKRIYC